MLKPINPDIATLIGFALEAILYGFYVLLFLVSLVFLVFRRSSRDLNAPLVTASCLLFTLCTTHFIIQFEHYVIHLRSVGVKGFSSETIPLGAGDFLLSVADFVGDLVLIYRCWLVWGKNYWVIIIPTLTALAGFICGCITFHIVLAVGLDHQVPPKNLFQIGTALFALPLCTNIIITALIVGRILYMGHTTQSKMSRETRLNMTHSTGANTMRLIYHSAGIVVESGVLYLLAQLVLVVLFSMENPAYKVVGYPIIQIYGIAPTLILCRVGMGISSERKFETTGADIPSFRGHSRRTVGTGGTFVDTHNDEFIAADAVLNGMDGTMPKLNLSSETQEHIELSFKTNPSGKPGLS